MSIVGRASGRVAANEEAVDPVISVGVLIESSAGRLGLWMDGVGGPKPGLTGGVTGGRVVAHCM